MTDQTDEDHDTADDGSTAQTATLSGGDTETTATEADTGDHDAEATVADEPEVTGASSDDASSEGGRDLVTYVEWAAFAILCLLALVATFRAYFAASEAIRIWFSRDFVPVFQFAFNVLVLIAAAAGISVLVRRLR